MFSQTLNALAECLFVFLLGRWWSVTSQSPRLYIALSVGWRPTMPLYLKWAPFSSTSHNTPQRCTAWWSEAPTSSQNRFQTSFASHLTCESNFLELLSPLKSCRIFTVILNVKLFISARLPIEKTRPLHSPQKWVSIKRRLRPMSFLSSLRGWRRSQSCWSSALCWMESLLVQLCCPLSKQNTRWVEWRATGWQVPLISS